jgi:hypothetical protein
MVEECRDNFSHRVTATVNVAFGFHNLPSLALVTETMRASAGRASPTSKGRPTSKPASVIFHPPERLSLILHRHITSASGVT